VGCKMVRVSVARGDDYASSSSSLTMSPSSVSRNAHSRTDLDKKGSVHHVIACLSCKMTFSSLECRTQLWFD
jgi:hypothetical protein